MREKDEVIARQAESIIDKKHRVVLVGRILEHYKKKLHRYRRHARFTDDDPANDPSEGYASDSDDEEDDHHVNATAGPGPSTTKRQKRDEDQVQPQRDRQRQTFPLNMRANFPRYVKPQAPNGDPSEDEDDDVQWIDAKGKRIEVKSERS